MLNNPYVLLHFEVVYVNLNLKSWELLASNVFPNFDQEIFTTSVAQGIRMKRTGYRVA
jgi:hypothetical protein